MLKAHTPTPQPSILVFACIFSSLLTACSGTHQEMSGLDYRPAVLLKDVDPSQYENDRAFCERESRQKATNYELTNVAMFRQCLIDRGYKLMS